MKQIIATFLVTLLCVGLTACKTTPESTLARIKTTCKLAAYVGTAEYLKEHPASRPQFEQASAALKILENAETIDFATLLAIVQRLPIDQLGNADTKIIITAATIILSDWGGSLSLDQLDNIRPVAGAIRQGIELGLQ
jgi:hypothetical protein